MFRPLEELIHAYFARTWPIAACENQLDVINGGLIPILRMGASRPLVPYTAQAPTKSHMVRKNVTASKTLMAPPLGQYLSPFI